MICRHCGKEYLDDFEYCPYCAEPKAVKSKISNQEQISEEEIIRAQRGADGHYILLSVVVAALWFFFGFFICQIVGWSIYPKTLGNDAFCDKADIFALIMWLGVFVGWIVLRWLNIKLSNESQKQKRSKKYVIFKQYQNDRTSICPVCGSHNIKIYRKGYNYRKGFWLRLFNIKGGGYIAGMDSNNVCCRCVNCGHDWKTNYDYRLIDK